MSVKHVKLSLLILYPGQLKKRFIFAELHLLGKLVGTKKEGVYISEAGDSSLHFSLSLSRSSGWKSAA